MAPVVLRGLVLWHLLGCAAFGPAPLPRRNRLLRLQRRTSTPSVDGGVFPESSLWSWENHRIRYVAAGAPGDPPLVLIHGFGASCDYYRSNIDVFAAAGYRVFAIDLLGFGGSDKPITADYSADLWTRQVLDFGFSIVKPR